MNKLPQSLFEAAKLLAAKEITSYAIAQSFIYNKDKMNSFKQNAIFNALIRLSFDLFVSKKGFGIFFQISTIDSRGGVEETRLEAKDTKES